MKRALAVLPLLALLACQPPATVAPSAPAAAPGTRPAPPPAPPAVDPHLPVGFPGGPKEAPKPALRLPGLYAIARTSRGAWALELHLAEPGSARTWEVSSKEGFAIGVNLEGGAPVARWTVPMARFATGDPFDIVLKSEGLEAPVRIVIPSMNPGQTVVGLQVQVLK